MKPLKTLSLVCLTAGLWAQEPGPSRLHGYVGGPYKVALADFTGNKHTDILLGYRNLGIVAVYQGDGAGKFSKPIRSNTSIALPLTPIPRIKASTLAPIEFRK